MENNNKGKQVQVSAVDSLKIMLATESVQKQFKNAMNEHCDLFTASLIELYSSDNYLQKCKPSQVIMEALKAATLKLPLNKNLGFAWIIPYGGRAQFQIGWRGYEQLAMRTGQYKNINCGAVLEGELKKIDKLSGAIDISGEAISDEEIGYFAHFELVNGFQKTAYWTKDQVEKHAIKYNQECKKAGALAGNWKEHFSKRAAATVLKHLIKNYGIMSVEMEDAFRKSNDAFDAEYQEMANSQPLTPADSEVMDADFTAEDQIDTNTGEVKPAAAESAPPIDDCPPFPVE